MRDTIIQRPTTLGGLLVVASLVAGPTVVASPDGFPVDRAAAIAEYESDPDAWSDGPVQYLMLDAERRLWAELADSRQRRAFMTWFWERRDPEPRDRVNPTRDDFYQRVAEANQRFAGFPRGWKSDRGRVWVLLGRPDSIRGNGRGTTVWTYFTRGRDRPFTNAWGEMQVGFVRTGPGREEIIGDLAAGSYPFYLLQAFEHTREALVADPELEFRPGR